MSTRASIYCRISSDPRDLALGVERQEQDCRALAERNGWEVGAVYIDNDISASTRSKKRRPQYNEMLRAARTGSFGAILAYSNSRLTRRPAEWIELIDLANTGRIRINTVASGEHDLSTANGRAMALTVAVWDAREAEETAEKVARAKAQAAESGLWRGGRRPYGYEADGVTVRQDEADAVAAATAALLSGASLRGLVSEWNAAGRLTSSGNPWTSNALRITLRRWRNAGLIERHGEVTGAAQWPAIVPEQQLRALRELLDNPARRTNAASTGRRWLGSGLYRCECGGTLIVSMANRSRVYRCRDGCGKLSRTQSDVDALVSRVVVERLRRPDLADLLDQGDDGSRAALDAEAVALRSRLDALAGLFAQGVVDAQQLAEGSRELRRRLDEVQAASAAAYSGTALAGVADAADPGAAWLDSPLDRRRAVLDALVSVTLLRGSAGRPAGWQPGQSYFRSELVRIEWR